MRRAAQQTRTYFLTFVTAQRRRIFQVTKTADLMLTHLQDQRSKDRIELHSFVVMPDHLHLLLTPSPDLSLEKAVQFIKGGFSFLLRSKMDVWERGYNEVQVTTSDKFDSFQTYIETNPVRAHIVTGQQAYPHSSSGRNNLVDPRPSWLAQG